MSSLKEVEKKRRTVFKPLLDNPFPQSQFPLLDPQDQAQILEFLLLLLDEIHKYNELQTSNFTPQKLQSHDNITLGFNSTVKVLEDQARAQVRGKPLPEKKLNYVFVCKADIQPPLITQQLPTLTYTASSNDFKVKLIQLPRGSINEIEKKLGRKTGIIGLSSYVGLSTKFIELLDNVEDVKVPWLQNMDFRPLKVKMLKTSAPLQGKVKKGKVEKKKKNKSSKST